MIEDRFTELIGKKLTNELTPDELQEFNKLVSGNPSYSTEYEAIKTFWQQKESSSANMASIFENIKRRTDISEREAGKIVPLQRRLKKWQTIAAALITVTIMGGLYKRYIAPNSRNDVASASWKQIQTPSSSTSKITLKDGTQVMLNAESSLRYPAAFDRETREVYLCGEGYFEVAKDRKHPFIVHTSNSDIRVLGTEFNVKAYGNDETFETTLLKGSIQVTFPNKPLIKVALKPKQKLVITRDADYTVTLPTYYNTQDSTVVETAWLSHKLVFKDQSFDVLANNLSRKYGVKILFEKNSLKEYKFTGEFEKEDLSQALFALQIITPFKYKVQGSNVYIY
jgi:transmembrane sensor